MKFSRLKLCLLALVLTAEHRLFALGGGDCDPRWLRSFGERPGTDDLIFCLHVFDDGAGPALYAGGEFATAGGAAAQHVARWDGSQWSALGGGLGGLVVLALCAFDDGSGLSLHAAVYTAGGGIGSTEVMKWDGENWSSVSPPFVGQVNALLAFDDGNGSALYAGGFFTSAGGVPANHVAKWNGVAWSPLGAGLGGVVNALAVFDGGTGAALHAGGNFPIGSGNDLAKWNGTSWSALGSGTNCAYPPDCTVNALAVYDAGGGAQLYAAGAFASVGGVAANRVARWDGAGWSAAGTGIASQEIYSLTVCDDGGGPSLFAGEYSVHEWDGASWAPLDDLVGGVAFALAAFDDGNGSAPVAAGQFVGAGTQEALRIAAWDGAGWSTLGTPPVDDGVHALGAFDDGGGTALYAGGDFTAAGGAAANYVARWDGAAWSTLGSGTNGPVHALAEFDGGGGPALHAGGAFSTAGGSPASRVARWNGAGWSPLGSGDFINGTVMAMAVFDYGAGPELCVGGSFTTVGGGTSRRFARWNGSSWTLQSGNGFGNGEVRDLEVYDDGSGADLYACGSFVNVSGQTANGVARSNGVSWVPFGSGLNGGDMHALAVFDRGDGLGPALYVAGSYVTSGGAFEHHVWKRTGSSWTPLGSGMDASALSLLAFHDGGAHGPGLYAGGLFTTAGGVLANHVARWDGSSWTALDAGIGGAVQVLASALSLGVPGPALYAGGEFHTSAAGDSFLARWQGSPDTEAPVLSCPAAVAARDHGAPGEVVHFSVEAEDDRDPAPLLVVEPPSGSFFPRGETLVHCTATDASGNESTCQFTVTVYLKTRRR